MKSFWKRNGIRMAVLLFFAVALVGCGTQKTQLLESVDTAMGTVIQQRIYVAEGTEEGLTAEVKTVIDQLEAEELSWRIAGSEVAELNSGATSSLSETMQEMLTQLFRVAEASEGTFDPTMGDVVQLWNIDEWAQMTDPTEYQLPTAEEIQEQLAFTGYEKLTLTEDGDLLLPEGMKLDLGAVGKGIALDRVQELLEGRVLGAVISAGGSILTYGERPDHTPWRVGIADPLQPEELIGYLELEGQWCVSTSGDYERYVEVGGVRYHHILDPRTGYPADSGVRSVTILTKDGLLSDALSTACFVLGAEKGLQLAETFEVDALFVTTEGQTIMTEGMEEYFHTS